jgi:hypothetical protein
MAFPLGCDLIDSHDSRLKRRRWSDQLGWAGLLAMGLFSSLLVLTVLRDASPAGAVG